MSPRIGNIELNCLIPAIWRNNFDYSFTVIFQPSLYRMQLYVDSL